MQSPNSFSLRTGLTFRLILAAILASLLLSTGVRSAHAATICTPAATDIVSPSCFEGGDGNLIVNDVFAQGNRIDWSTLVGFNPPPTQYQDPRNPNDDVFKASGADEQTPSGWQLEIDKAPSKADILNTVTYTELVPQNPGHIFLYAGFESDAGGNVNVSFELNKGNPAGGLLFNNGNSLVPYRSENDLLVTYDGGVGSVKIGVCYWHGTNLAGNWFTLPNGGGVGIGGAQKDCGTTTAAQAIGNINAADMPNPYLNLFSNPILLGNFGEMSIDLTATIAAGQGNLCFQFGGVWMHSRSSSQANSTMEDYILPHPINANSCGLSVDKTVAVSPDGALSPTMPLQAGLTYGNSKPANNGDTAYYRIAVTNTGTQTITHDVAGAVPFGPADVTDDTCSSPTIVAADKLHPITGNANALDGTPTSFDSGDVWIFRCKRQYTANDGDPLTNTATATGHVGSTPVTDDDTADVTRIPPGKVRAGKTVVGGTGNETWFFTVAGVSKTPAIGNGEFTSSENVVPGTPVTITEGAQDAGTGTFDVTAIVCEKVGGGSVTYTPNTGTKSVSVTPASGEDITCTFTNTKRGTVRIDKVTHPSGDAQMFTFDPGAGLGAPAEPNFELADATAPKEFTVVPGTYTVQELPKTGWALAGISCNDSNSTGTGDTATYIVAAGETVTCTFTNDKNATLITKKVVNSATHPGATFDFNGTAITGAPATLGDNATNQKTITDFTGSPSFTSTETGQTGWSTVSACTGDVGGANVSSGGTTSATFRPDPGETITCTFTNTEDATLITKKVVNSLTNPTETFLFNGTAITGAPATLGNNDTNTTTISSFAGSPTFTSTETGKAGWSTVSACSGDVGGGNVSSGGTTSATFRPDPGETITCTFTNTEGAKLITKKVVNSTTHPAATFVFNGTAITGAPVSLGDNDTNEKTITDFTGNPSFDATETTQAGWSTTIDCTGDQGQSNVSSHTGDTATFRPDPGETITCTFTNTEDAKLITKKVVDSVANPTETFNFAGTAITGGPVLLGDNDTNEKTISDFTGNPTFDSTETTKPGWSTAINCTGDQGQSNVSTHTGDTATFKPDPGETITCTFTNTENATLTTKKIVNSAAHPNETFDFDGTAITGGPVPLGNNDTNTTTITSFAGNPTFDATETTKAGWATVIACTGDIGQANLSTHTTDTATFRPDPGENITCTFTNTEGGMVRAAKHVVNGKGGETFPLTVGNTTTAQRGDGDVTPYESVTPGSPITVSEGPKDGGPAGTFDTTVACVDAAQTPVTTASNTGKSVDVTPTAGQVITCTFTNTRRPDPPPPTSNPAPPNPKVSIDKVGPATALAGDRITYGIAVTNTGDQPFPEQNVVLTDAQCEAPPTLVGKLGDTTPATLDPGETWGYMCTVQTALGQDAVHNVASVDAATVLGQHVTASDPADTALVQPQQGVEPLLPSNARLAGPKSCLATRKTATAVVTGRRIAAVTFLIDGKKIKTIKAAAAQKNGRFVITLDARRYNFDKHSVTARVTFLAGSTLKTRTLKLTFARCVTKAVTPKFTG